MGSKMQDENLLRSLDERIRMIVGEVLEKERGTGRAISGVLDDESSKLQERLQRIMSKEFISAKEAALLLNCSERHVHNLVDRARRQIGDHPIPFRKVGETTTFLRTELIEWTKAPMTNQLIAVS